MGWGGLLVLEHCRYGTEEQYTVEEKNTWYGLRENERCSL